MMNDVEKTTSVNHDENSPAESTLTVSPPTEGVKVEVDEFTGTQEPFGAVGRPGVQDV
jgi:hypothetical protein